MITHKLTEEENEYFDRLSQDNTALVRGTFDDKEVAIVVQMYPDEESAFELNVYPIAILANKDWMKDRLAVEGKKLGEVVG